MIRSKSLLLPYWVAAAIVLPAPVSAQPRPAEPSRPVEQPSVAAQLPPMNPNADAEEKRRALIDVLQKYPPGLGRVLRGDPTLLQNDGYLAQYPVLAAFLAAHPEVAHSPNYYFEHIYMPGDPEPRDAQSQAIQMWRNTFEAISVLVVMIFIASVLTWLVRTVLEHRRWLRLSRVQTEVHGKLLDRFAGTADWLAYAQTPAGRRFLEAAPIPTDGPRSIAAPLGRILWSVQLGVVLAVGGLGFQFVSGRVVPEVAEGLWMIGVLALAFGIGFMLSGAASYILSRRMGLLEPMAIGDQGSGIRDQGSGNTGIGNQGPGI